jgi:phage terminase small subunit
VLKRPHIVAALRERGLDPPRGVHPATQIRKPVVRRPRSAMSVVEERFALAYLVCGNAAEAARRAGIKTARPHGAGCRLLHLPRVAAFIEAERAASIERTRIDVDRVKRELARLAFVDIGDIVDWSEDALVLRPSAAISPDDRAAIAQLKVKQGKQGLKATIRLHSKQHALDSLAKLLGLYGNRKPPTVIDAAERLDANQILRERLLRIARRGASREEPASSLPEAGARKVRNPA